jgi:tripartite-type tricarboxylate transporter receptor subunit TctC
MSRKLIFRFLLVGVILVFVSSGTALAAGYPSKPITMIIPLSAGGSHDLNARVFTSIIPEYLGQPVVVKLMPGAGGQTGTAAAVRAKPDGYTLIFTHNYIDQLQPLIEKLPYDTTKALVTVWRLNYAPPIVFVRSDKPWKTLEELLDYGRKNPGKLQFAHSGNWGATFTPGAIMLSKAGVNAQFIPYKGGGPAMAAILAGDADFHLAFPSVVLPHAKAGKVRLLAVAGDKRLKEIPEVRCFKELGFQGGVMERIIMAPRKMPEDRLVILRQAFRKLYDDKTFKNMMGKLAENMESMDGPEYEKLRAEQKKEYTELVERITGEKIKGK